MNTMNSVNKKIKKTSNPKLHKQTSLSRLPRLSKKTKIALIIIFVLFLSIFIVNKLTPYPSILTIRALINSTQNVVKIGPYADNIANVKTSEPIDVPVDGLPNAQLTIYSQDSKPEPEATARPLILFIHGGGWVAGKASQVSTFAQLLASNGYVVANLEYSVAPEYKYPAPIKQSAAAIQYLQAHAKNYSADPAKFFIGGNSAGAQIAAQLGAIITNPELKNKIGVNIEIPSESLKGLILINGVYDFDTVRKDNFPGFESFIWSYTGRKDFENYDRIDELSTIKQATSKYPATFMTAGDADPLEPQTRQFDAALRKKGVNVTSLYWTDSGKNLPHDYIYDFENDAAQTAYKEAVIFMNEASQE